MAQDTVRVLDGLCRERHLGRAELLDAVETCDGLVELCPGAKRLGALELDVARLA